jgi:soluble lytic murein transglycosylase-like protein
MLYDEYLEPIIEDDEIIEYWEDEGTYLYYGAGWTPDPVLIAGIILFFGLLLWLFLTRLTPLIFKDEFSQLRLEAKAIAVEQQSQELDTSFTNPQEKNSPNWTGECEVSSLYPARITRWCGLITQYAKKHDLDPDLVAALVWQESGGNEQAYSQSGAVGLMQVMPRDGLAASFLCAGGPCFKDRPSSDELRDPEYNIAFGTKYLAGLVRRTGNLREALRSYGPMDAGYTYSDKVLSIFNRYKD